LGDAGFALETQHQFGVSEQVGVQQLEGNNRVRALVNGFVH
jgi:hypothetical protein